MAGFETDDDASPTGFVRVWKTNKLASFFFPAAREEAFSLD
jgi:hypothetical protein